jgi:hypothetical protein
MTFKEKVKSDPSLGHPMLYHGTEFKRRVKWRVNLFCTLCVGSGSVVYYTYDYINNLRHQQYQKESVRNQYSSNNICLIYLQMENIKCAR